MTLPAASLRGNRWPVLWWHVRRNQAARRLRRADLTYRQVATWQHRVALDRAADFYRQVEAGRP